jgi:4-hydroxybenzoate polyprenyltransferase
MRPKQWVKNFFVLAPLIFTGKFVNVVDVSHSLMAFLLFCIASSATYILNDIYDVEQDKLHPQKFKERPLASGEISLTAAAMLLILLYLLLIASYFIAPTVSLVIVAYILINVAYTFYFKHQPVFDIFSIAIGFVLRVFGGTVALHAPQSGWMLITTLCLALYLAAIKRRQELRFNGEKGRKVLEKYSVSLVEHYANISATGALIFYSMFVMSEKKQLLITIPFVLFGLFRYWYIVEKLEGGESPTDALLSDWPLLLCIVAWVSMCCWAYLP